MRALFVLLVCGSILAHSGHAQQPAAPAEEPVKVAEGGYNEMNSWVLWRYRKGYEVQIQIHFAAPEFKETRQSEIIEFASSFIMKRFRYEAQKFPGLHDGALDCSVAAQAMQCTSSFRGQEGRGSIPLPVANGCAAQFGVHIALLDLPWFFTTLVAKESGPPPPNSEACVVSLAFDGDSPDRLITANPHRAEINYLGQQRLTILGKQVSALKYRVTTHTYNGTVWTAANGLLLAVEWAGMRFELTRYKQYEEFTPELVGALEQSTPKRATRRFSN